MLFIVLEQNPQLPPKVTHKFQQQALQGRKQTEQTGVVTNITIFLQTTFLGIIINIQMGYIPAPYMTKNNCL